MIFRKIFLLSVFILTVSIISCKEEPNSIGVELIGSDLIVVKSFDSQSDSLVQTSTNFKKVIPLGLASRILIGKYGDIEASTLLRFVFGLADSTRADIIADNLNVLDAWVILTTRYVYVDSMANMDFTVHKVNSKWSPDDFDVDSLPSLQYDMEDVSTNLSPSDTQYTFNLNPELVLSWLKNTADKNLENNEGIYLKPGATSSKVVGFEALTAISADAAKLFFVLEKPGVYTDTTSGFIFADVSLVEGDVPVLPADEIGIQSSIAVYSRFNFDLSGIPRGVVINNAELTFTTDTVNTVTGNVFNNAFRGMFVSDSVTNETLEGADIQFAANGNKYTSNVTNYVRSWVNESNNNYGIIITPINQDLGLEMFALKNSSADSLSRPRLKIVYTARVGE